ncbi:hypothetical protein BIW11_12538 [Tropilaelaps mercedesae]|uniref:Tudor domain-containing protein n=1 Tax=Tropilaelaps mercedesae TaxID=418985 RepID=A0A1V9X6G8_9ACAR|nr:hypothetical protein BIW11_12538 [Tropilaelaps mercedesae]
MKAISESASSIRGQATIDDFCEGETLVSAPLLFGVSTRIQCRARVMRIYSETDVEVFYIDYGLIQNVPLKDLRLLTAVKLLKIGQLAIPCKLSRSLPQAIVHSMRQTKALKLMFSDEDDDGNVCDFAVGDDSTSCGSNRSDQNRCASNGLYYIKAMLPLPIGDPFTLRYLPRNPPPRGASAE